MTSIASRSPAVGHRPGLRAPAPDLPADVPRVDLHVVPDAGAVPGRDGHRAGRLRRPTGDAALGGVTYLAVPGARACSPRPRCSRRAFEATFPIIGGLDWSRIFHAMYATPISPRDIALGNLAWIAAPADADRDGLHGRHRRCSARPTRRSIVLGDPGRGPDRAWRSRRRSRRSPRRSGRRTSSTTIFRFGITPLFLFSGTFFPIEHAAGRPPADRLAHAAVPRRRR